VYSSCFAVLCTAVVSVAAAVLCTAAAVLCTAAAVLCTAVVSVAAAENPLHVSNIAIMTTP